MASIQSIHMSPDPLTSTTATKRKIGDVRVDGSPSIANDIGAETPSSGDAHADNEDGEARGEMSESKRRAQNRAAQRAFRERKERHLKELETRLAQLESESRSWKSTNMALRSQLSLLEEELQQYRRPQGDQRQPQSAIVDTQPAGLPAHMLPPQQQSYQPPQTQTLRDRSGRGQDARSTSSNNGSSPDSMSIPGLSFDSPGSASSTTPNRADEFCDKLSLACGTRDRPVPAGAPHIAAESPRWQEDVLLGKNKSDWGVKDSWAALNQYTGPEVARDPYGPAATPGTAPAVAASNVQPRGKSWSTEDPLNLDFGILSSGFGGFGMPSSGEGSNQNDQGLGLFPGGNVNGLLNTDYGMFDPLEDMLEWNPSKDTSQALHAPPQKDAIPSQPQYANQNQNQTHTSQPAPPRGVPGQSPQQLGHAPAADEPRFKVEGDVASNPMGPMGMGYFGNTPNAAPLAGLEEQVPAASQRFIPCSDVWDRICSHPRFGEIDINSMCQELRSKARCSNTGVVLDEEDVDKVLGTIK